MSFYDDASLVVIPSGYKTSKVYAEKPTDGSGDLAFTRTGDTATRVNSAGLIEKVRTNLITYSEQLNNAAWTKEQVTITANATTSPDGTITADKVIANATAGDKYVAQIFTVAIGDAFTTSAYFKSSEYTYAFIRFGGLVSNPYVIYNLATQSVVTTSGLTSSSITSVGNGWYRITATATSTTTTIAPVLMVIPSTGYTLGADNIPEFTGDGTSGGFIWGGQLELSDFGATDYIPTTTAAVSVGPVANVPRLDYLGSTCPRLNLEPQRSNLFTFSENFDNAAWTKVTATVTANNVASPDGSTNADKVEFSSGYINGATTVTANQTYTISFFAKKGTANLFQISEAFYVGTTVAFDLNTGTVTSGTGKIENYGNGWYRCSMQFTYGVGQTVASWLVRNYQAGYIYLWGAQLEAGSYATSYIPTLSASATRGADAASKTGISSLIGQQEGVIYWEGILPSNTEGGSSLAANIINSDRNINANSGYSINYIPSTQGITFSFFIGNGTFVPDVNLGNNLFAPGTYVKIAAAYKSGSSALVVNGGSPAVSTASFTSTTSISALWLNDVNVYFGYPTNLQTSVIAFFLTRLTNAQLIELTTI